MKRNKKQILILILIGVLISGAGVLAINETTIDWWVISGGGGFSSGGEVSINSTLGQPFTGTSVGGDVVMGTSFWSGVAESTYNVYLPLVVK